MTSKRENEALKAYFNILEKRGATADDIRRREPIFSKLISYLEGKPCDGSTYREAVEELLTHIKHEEWPYCLSVVREYFHFWMNDIKAIVKLEFKSDLNFKAINGEDIQDNLNTIWNQIDSEKFTMVEMWPIKSYIHALKSEGGEKTLIETRVKLVKLLLINMRKLADQNSQNYRYSVDASLPLFKSKETRSLFLEVVREFYYFWIGDPNAASFIQIENMPLAI